MLSKKEVVQVIDELFIIYPDAKCELNFSNSFQLLIATVLSAQTTDKKVNEVTEKLFKKYKCAEDFLGLNQKELEVQIKEIGLYKNKSKYILSLSKALVEKFNSEVPSTMELLLTLDGVGRKTANVVLSNAYNIPSFAVDTHVFRVANRIGLSCGKDAFNVEKQLMDNIPKEKWIRAHHSLIFHGRRTCKAQNPLCEICGIKNLCEFNLRKK